MLPWICVCVCGDKWHWVKMELVWFWSFIDLMSLKLEMCLFGLFILDPDLTSVALDLTFNHVNGIIIFCIFSHYLQSDSNASYLRAARAGNFEKVLDYLKTGVDINICNQVWIIYMTMSQDVTISLSLLRMMEVNTIFFFVIFISSWTLLLLALL